MAKKIYVIFSYRMTKILGYAAFYNPNKAISGWCPLPEAATCIDYTTMLKIAKAEDNGRGDDAVPLPLPPLPVDYDLNTFSNPSCT